MTNKEKRESFLKILKVLQEIQVNLADTKLSMELILYKDDFKQFNRIQVFIDTKRAYFHVNPLLEEIIDESYNDIDNVELVKDVKNFLKDNGIIF